MLRPLTGLSMLEKITKDFLTLWVTIEPFSTVVLFAALTARLAQPERRRVARKAIIYSTVILLGSMVVGQALLTAMRISLHSFQVAGGLVLLFFSVQMIFGIAGGGEKTEEGHDMAVFPLAVPSLAGAEAIMASVILTDNNAYSITTQIMTGVVLVLIMAITWGMLLAAEPIFRVLGKNGAAILERVTGMILAALAIELMMNGLGVARWMNAT